MEIRLVGTGGSGGWPRPGCRCASCERARSAGRRRAPAHVLVDGVLRIDSGGPPCRASDARRGGDGTGGGDVMSVGAGYRVERVPFGWDVTGPDGARLLVGEWRGPTTAPPVKGEGGPGGEPRDTGPGATGAATTGPYDIVLLDLLENPAQLGALRRRGLVHARTVVAVLHADHRVSSEEELFRRCQFWGAIVPGDGDILAATPGPRAGPGCGLSQPPRRVLVLGGARSGKSRHAELRLAAEPRVTYLAAGPYLPGAQPAADSEWTERVAAHRARRPPWWQTVESLDAAAALRSESGAVLFDGAGTWLAAVMDESGAWADDDGEGEGDRDAGPGSASRLARAEVQIAAKVDELLEAWRQTTARVVAVSDEVGSSVHPPTRAGRVFRDQLGWLNQRLAAESEETVLMVAGRALTLPS
jgi:adenosylcobinamide kinase / adenosylcobinamide-phosphate guanylyltransferase